LLALKKKKKKSITSFMVHCYGMTEGGKLPHLIYNVGPFCDTEVRQYTVSIYFL